MDFYNLPISSNITFWIGVKNSVSHSLQQSGLAIANQIVVAIKKIPWKLDENVNVARVDSRITPIAPYIKAMQRVAYGVPEFLIYSSCNGMVMLRNTLSRIKANCFAVFPDPINYLFPP